MKKICGECKSIFEFKLPEECRNGAFLLRCGVCDRTTWFNRYDGPRKALDVGCHTCAHATWPKTKTGKVRITGDTIGDCGYQVTWPDLPVCYRDYDGTPLLKRMIKRNVWKGIGNDCPCWKGKSK